MRCRSSSAHGISSVTRRTWHIRHHHHTSVVTYLVANGDGRVSQAGVPGHADLHGDRLGEVVAHPVRHLHQHHSEADGQQEDPEEAPTHRPIHVDRRPQTRDVDLAVSGFALFLGNRSLEDGGPIFCTLHTEMGSRVDLNR